MNIEINQKRNSQLFIFLFVAVIGAFGPIVTDFYLPVMPQMNTAFHTSTSLVQLSLTVSLLGLGIGQLFFGPISDKYGRRKPLIFSLLLFIFSTFACIFSPNIGVFVLFRLFQGLAGAGGIVIAQSIAVDLYKGKTLLKFFSMLATIQVLAPIVAPLAGGFLSKITNWQGLFFGLFILGVFILCWAFFFRETLPSDKRINASVMQSFKPMVPILKKTMFRNYTLALGFVVAAFFAYLSSSPFIFQKVYHLSPTMFSVLFACNAVGIMSGSQVVRLFKNTQNALKLGIIGVTVMTIIAATFLQLNANVYFIEISFWIMLFFFGIVTPAMTSLALDSERNAAGNASALLGFSRFAFGGLVSPLVGLGSIITSTGIALVACSICSLIFVFTTLRTNK